MKEDIKDILDKLNIANEEYINIKNIYGLYKREKYSSNLLDIHDVLSIKVCVDTEEECYKALGSIHKLYHPVNALFKDYICNPKANRYQSLHTTLFTGEDFLTQVRIRTYKMDEIASLGIAQYWKTNGESAKKRMQDSIESKFQFYKSLSEIENGKMSDEIYFDVVKNEVLNKKAHVFDINGNMIELPSGSHPIDFAARVLGDNILYLDYITVNNSIVDNNYQLQDNDILKLVLNYDKVTNLTNYSNNATTTYAKRLLKKQF
jgi:GTP pyrophosphokinase